MTAERAALLAEQDQWQRELGRALGQSVKDYLAERSRAQHKISAIQDWEFEGIAWEVVGKYHQIRAAKIAELKSRGLNSDGLRDIADRHLGTG
jgi:hypothetical protein